MAVDGIEIRGKDHRVPDRSDAIPLSPDGFTTAGEIADLATPGGGAPIVTVIANDTDITVAPFNGTTIVIYTALTAPRTLTLPPASGLAQVVIVKDGNELATSDTPILVVPTGDDSVLGITSIVEAHDALGGGIELSYANDSDTTWRSIFDPSASTAVVYDQLQTLIGQLGGTDGDGNVYSIKGPTDLDPTLSLRCVAANGDIVDFFVGASSGGVNVQQHDDGIQNYINVSVTGGVDIYGTTPIRLNGVFIDPTGGNEGDVLTQQADGSFKPQAP